MVSMEEVSDRVSRLEGAYEHLATKADIAELHGATKADIAELRGATKADIQELRGDTMAAIVALETRLIRWTVTTMVAGMAATATIALVVASLASS